MEVSDDLVLSDNPNQNLSALKIDLSSAEFLADPYPTYRRLLTESPVYRHPVKGELFISDPELIHAVLKNNALFSSDRASAFSASLNEEQSRFVQPLTDSLSRWLLFQDPPKHMPLRKIINASLNQKTISELGPYIESVAASLLEEMKMNRKTDLIQEFAYPLPALVIAHLLGVPTHDIDRVKKWSDDIARFFGGKGGPSAAIRTQQSIGEMADYLSSLLSEENAGEYTGVMRSLKEYQSENTDFTDDDIIANCAMLLFAGHETTTNLIANLWYQLQQHPEQTEYLISHPESVPAAVAEGLRFDGPVQRLTRIATEDTEIAGYPVAEGQRVYLMLAAMNRSSDLYDDPDHFSVRRAVNNSTGFGYGPHLCSGAALARLETRIAIQQLLKYFPEGRITESPEYHLNPGLRAMKSLHIDIG